MIIHPPIIMYNDHITKYSVPIFLGLHDSQGIQVYIKANQLIFPFFVGFLTIPQIWSP